MILNTKQDLFLHELREIFSCETQVTETLPLIEDATENKHFRESIEIILGESSSQKERLLNIAKNLNIDIFGDTSLSMEGLLSECKSIAFSKGDPEIVDLLISKCLLRTQIYIQDVYDSVSKQSKLLGYEQEYQLLKKCLDEESLVKSNLNKIAN